jgi:rod shape-determining protein MreD
MITLSWFQRDTRLFPRLVPVLSAFLFALFSVLPFDIPGLIVVSPAFALMAVFHWSIYRPDLFPIGAAFVLGLLVDLLDGTPYVGLSALIFLLTRTALLHLREYFLDRPFAALWGGFFLVAATAFALEWSVTSLVHKSLLGLRPVVFQALLTVACFPVGSYLLASAHRAFLGRS